MLVTTFFKHLLQNKMQQHSFYLLFFFSYSLDSLKPKHKKFTWKNFKLTNYLFINFASNFFIVLYKCKQSFNDDVNTQNNNKKFKFLQMPLCTLEQEQKINLTTTLFLTNFVSYHYHLNSCKYEKTFYALNFFETKNFFTHF